MSHFRTDSVGTGPPTPAVPRSLRPNLGAPAADVDVPWDAIDRCLGGDSLLKFGRAGEPHFRVFKLKPDFSAVTWTSKGREQSVSLDEVRKAQEKGGGFLPGKQTALFKRNMKKRYDARVCFSLDYSSKTLDLVCSDPTQYNAWRDSLTYILKYGPPSAKSRFGKVKHRRETSVATSMGDYETRGGRGGSVVRKSNLGRIAGAGDGGDGMEDEAAMPVMDIRDIYTWGFGGQGQLGHNGTFVHEDTSTPILSRALLDMNVLDIDCGLEHTIAVVKPGKLFAWGHGGGGRLGTAGSDAFSGVLGTSSGVPVREIKPTPIALTGESKRGTLFKAVACGDYHSLGLTTEGKVYSWGVGFVGQRGVSLVEGSDPAPALVNIADSTVTSIAAGYTTSACVTSDGKLYTWGGGSCGKLGHGTSDGAEDGLFEDESVPRQVLGTLLSRKVIVVACGDFHTLAVVASATGRRRSEELYAWGDNSFGQLGTGDFKGRAEPTKVILEQGDNYTKLVSVSAGSAHSAAIFDFKIFGPIVHVWGAGNMGQLGLRRFLKKDSDMQTKKDNSSSDVKTGDGSSNDLRDNDEDGLSSVVSTYCVPVPTKLAIQDTSSMAEAGTSAPERANPVAVHKTGSYSRGPNLTPAAVSCGANHTAVLIADTPSMREKGMGGKVFMFGESSSGQSVSTSNRSNFNCC